jgi:hypothetical protein
VSVRTYRIWCGMMSRCAPTRAARAHHPRYAGRGITVCERWRTYENFLADMGPCPEGPSVYPHSIERIDNDGNYEPSNCEWKSIYDQQLNRGGKMAKNKSWAAKAFWSLRAKFDAKKRTNRG